MVHADPMVFSGFAPAACRGLSAWLLAVTLAALAPAQDGVVPAVTDDDKPAAGGPESIQIEAYTGPPIFLDEQEAPPPPTEVESRTVSEKYPESDQVRFERGVVKYSDDTVRSDGPAKEFYKDGTPYYEGQYKAGFPTGEWVYYHPNGKVAKKVTYVEGLPDGEVRSFTPDEKPIAIRVYKAGKRTGEWITFGPDGQTKSRLETYVDGLAEGPWVVYYTDGKVRQESSFKAGKIDGVAREYSSDGTKRAEAEFKDGLRDGKTTTWQSDGKVIERVFQAGRAVESADAPAE
jgi:antitoxin component YwqK of YwqJK toxin-antitoxin module